MAIAIVPTFEGERDVACTAVGKVECDPAAGDDRDAASDHVFGDEVRFSESYHDDLCLIEERQEHLSGRSCMATGDTRVSGIKERKYRRHAWGWRGRSVSMCNRNPIMIPLEVHDCKISCLCERPRPIVADPMPIFVPIDGIKDPSLFFWRESGQGMQHQDAAYARV